MPPHYKAHVKVKFLVGETWPGNADNYVEIFVDNFSILKENPDSSGAVGDICGNIDGNNDEYI